MTRESLFISIIVAIISHISFLCLIGCMDVQLTDRCYNKSSLNLDPRLNAEDSGIITPGVLKEKMLTKWFNFISVAMIKHPIRKQLRGERVYYTSQFQAAAHYCGEAKAGTPAHHRAGAGSS